MPISWKMFWLKSWELGNSDNGTGSLTVDGTGVDGKGFGDSGSGALTVSGTKTEALAHTGSGTCSLTVAGTSTASLAHSGSGTCALTLSGTKTEALAHSGSGSGTITVSGTSTDAKAYADSGSAALTVSGSGSDGELEAGSGTGQLTLDGTAVESWGIFYVDSGSGALTLDGSAVEDFTPGVVTGKSKTYRHYPAGTGDVEVSYGVLPPIVYNDSGTGTIRLAGSSSDSFTSPPKPVTLRGWGWESFHVEPPPINHTDAATGLLALNGYLVDSYHQHEGSGDGAILLGGEGVELFDDGFLIRRDREDELIVALALALA